jgi:hypothetical protein
VIAEIEFRADGRGHCLYTDALDLQRIGPLACRRASTIEFNASTQHWEVRAADSATLLYTHPSRQACLDWERANLRVPE